MIDEPETRSDLVTDAIRDAIRAEISERLSEIPEDAMDDVLLIEFVREYAITLDRLLTDVLDEQARRYGIDRQIADMTRGTVAQTNLTEWWGA